MPPQGTVRGLVAPPVDVDSLRRLPAELRRDVELVQALMVSGNALRALCSTTGMGFAHIGRVTRSHWVACDVLDRLDFGIGPGTELSVETTLCGEVVLAGTEIVIEDVASDPSYAEHHCPALYGFRSYVAVPIPLADGSIFGTLCALDPEPRTLDERSVLAPIRLFAELVGLRIDDRRALHESRRALADERAMAGLREEFIAVVGHDLRNPLSAIEANAQLIDALSADEGVREANGAVLRSSARMGDLIANLMDFARGRLGGGIELGLENVPTLGDVLHQVVRELADAHPERTVEAGFDVPGAVRCDPARIAQLLSNLVGNAIAHGDGERPVRVLGRVDSGELRLSVENAGEPIPPEIRSRLFEPFRRSVRDTAGGHGHTGRSVRDGGRLADGLGLGLHIAAQIAEAHGGRIDVDSDAVRTAFTFTMPTDGPRAARADSTSGTVAS